MRKATASIYLDEYRPKKTGKCSVKIKVTFDRKRNYYQTNYELTKDEFEKVVNGKRLNNNENEMRVKLNSRLNKAREVIEDLSIFTFNNFDESYFEERNVTNSVSFAFDKYVNELKTQDRIGTAVSYNCAKNSLARFDKNLTFADVTPSFLRKYERWMLKEKRSITTVGIYLRSLKAIYNQQNIDASIYPFGNDKKKYQIPASKNIKKSLTVEEIAKIYNYEAKPMSSKDMAKDYWLFLYLANGMNVKDFCMLKWENIDGKMLKYKRAKTKRSQKESKYISVALKDETLDIIKKWGQPSILKSAYIFPHLKPEFSAEKKYTIYQQLTKNINKYMKVISVELGLEKNITTYFARHSFATVLKRSGAQIGMISDLLGHSSVDVTESYLGSFENDQIHEQTNPLTAGFKKAN